MGAVSESGSSVPGRRPEGTRRRQLEWITNFALVVVSLFGISVGAGLIIFYRLDHFGFIAEQFSACFYIAVATFLASCINFIFLLQVQIHPVAAFGQV